MAKETFSDEVKQLIYKAQNGYCKGCNNMIHSFHHKLPNNQANRKRYPHFIHSPMNCAGLCLNCHTNKSHLFKISIGEANAYEEYLENLK